MWQRATSAGKVDMAALEHGRLLGWYAIRGNGKTSAACKAANRHNFYANRMPDIGWPGSGPHPNCFPAGTVVASPAIQAAATPLVRGRTH